MERVGSGEISPSEITSAKGAGFSFPYFQPCRTLSFLSLFSVLAAPRQRRAGMSSDTDFLASATNSYRKGKKGIESAQFSYKSRSKCCH